MVTINQLATRVFLCFALIWSAPSWSMDANCDGELTPDQELQVELCSAHPGCRLVASIAKGCQSLKKLLTRLAADKRPIDDAKMDAIFEGASGKSVCWRNFNFQACKAHLFGANELNDNQPDADQKRPDPSGQVIGAPPKAQRLNLTMATSRRKNIKDEDDNLYSRVDFECRSGTSVDCPTLLAQLDRLMAKVKDVNEDPEFLSFLPPIELQSPKKLARKGWNKTADGWVNPEADRAISACERDKREVSELVEQRVPGARERVEGFKAACADIHEQYFGLSQFWISKLGKGPAGSVVGQTTDFEQRVQAQASRPDQTTGRSANEVRADWERKQQELMATARASEQVRLAAAKREASAQESARLEKQRDDEKWESMTNSLLEAAQAYSDAKESKRRQQREAQQRAERESRIATTRPGQTIYNSTLMSEAEITISAPGRQTVSGKGRAGTDDPAVGGISPHPQTNRPSTSAQVGANRERAVDEAAQGESALNCLTVRASRGLFSREISNSCDHGVIVSWCFIGVDCKHGNWGVVATAFLAPHRSTSLTSWSPTKGREVYYIACKGRYSNIKETAAQTFQCGKVID